VLESEAEEGSTVPGPGGCVPDVTEGLTRVEDLPKPVLHAVAKVHKGLGRRKERLGRGRPRSLQAKRAARRNQRLKEETGDLFEHRHLFVAHCLARAPGGGPAETLAAFACPNEDCADFNRFRAGNLSMCERIGKDKQIRRLYCRTCGHRFSERQGTLLAYSKLPEETVVRIVKCLAHGCSIEAAADICAVRRRTVESLLDRAGRRAEDFHRLQREKITKPLEVVELDELHGRSCPQGKRQPQLIGTAVADQPHRQDRKPSPTPTKRQRLLQSWFEKNERPKGSRGS
jgi:transposase-like protein